MTGYRIHTDVKFEPLELIDAGKLADRCEDRWWNQTLCRTRAPVRAVVLMIEAATIVPTGDV